MRPLTSQPTLADQVYQAILTEISEGKFGMERRLVQEEIAESLGVSRQPVQQALLLLRSQGLLRDAPGRGLMVAPLDPQYVRNLYEVRGMLDGLASAKAAERAASIAAKEGRAFIDRGRQAVASRSIPQMIATDMEFHHFLYALSGNPLIAEQGATHWSYLRRLMGEVLLHGETPQAIWDQHQAILDAIVAGNPAEAERLARHHTSAASTALLAQFGEAQDKPPAASQTRAIRRRA